MDITSGDYEKLGAFYLGREYDLEARQRADDLLLYDSKDLVTHGVVLGMTGSGKTGLCIAMLEEAAIDGVPAVVIDPKGDIANLLLTFPDLSPADFRPWIHDEDARRRDMAPDDFAARQAHTWRKGLAEWGQDGERIRRLRESVEIRVLTPGSSTGLPVSILGSLAAPCTEISSDPEALAERIEGTASSLAGLLGIRGEGIQNRAQTFLGAILDEAWSRGEDLDLAALIQRIQAPPFESIGVMPIETVFPARERTALALRVNQLIASPSFRLWLEGEPLDPDLLLHSPEGKPRISILSIAHLGDDERMFFVSLALNQMVDWMRRQGGTTSLRALLYMDEIAGFLPPVANPPSKPPMMTLLKQARAFGLGTLLATQNPVDLDYKALSNIGSWFIGRLQTERDKARVLEGLETAASTQGVAMNRSWLDRALSSLGSRVFLMNNVHEDAPTLFETRWVMSYLAGPLARDQIRSLMDPHRAKIPKTDAADAAPVAVSEADEANRLAKPQAAAAHPTAIAIKPDVQARVEEVFLPLPEQANPADFIYEPHAIRAARVLIEDRKLGVSIHEETIELARVATETALADWDEAEPLDEIDPAALPRVPIPGIPFLPLPARLGTSPFHTATRRDFTSHLHRHSGIDLLKSPSTGLVSEPGECERDFRLRLAQNAREHRDSLIEDLRARYQKQIEREQAAIQRSEATLERTRERARSARLRTLTTAGTTILSALMGRKALSATNVRRAGTLGNQMTRSSGSAAEVARAEQRVAEGRETVARLESELRAAMHDLEKRIDPLTEVFETTTIKPLKKDIEVTLAGLAWVPVLRTSETPAT